MNEYGYVNLSFSTPKIQTHRIVQVAMHQSGTILILHSNGAISSSCDRKEFRNLKTSDVVYMALPTSCSDVIVIDKNNNVKLLDIDTGRTKKLLLTETDGVKSPKSVALDDSGLLWIGSEEGKIYFVNYGTLLATSPGTRV